jgi:hypothetical protein
MNPTLIRKLVMTGFATAGLSLAGPAMPHLPSPDTAFATNPGYHSASTPGTTPSVERPSISTPSAATPSVSTPATGAQVNLPAIPVPASVKVDSDQLIGRDIESPSSTPGVSESPKVDSITVPQVQVPSVSTPDITLSEITLPAKAAADSKGNLDATAHAADTEVRVSVTR